jgi:hypothetical protein
MAKAVGLESKRARDAIDRHLTQTAPERNIQSVE